MRLVLLFLTVFLCVACATNRATKPEYSGTVTFSCGVTDGGASRLSLTSGELPLLLHVEGESPKDLQGELQASILQCEEQDKSICRPSESATIAFTSNDGRTIEGNFSTKHSAGSFRVKIVEPSSLVVCG